MVRVQLVTWICFGGKGETWWNEPKEGESGRIEYWKSSLISCQGVHDLSATNDFSEGLKKTLAPENKP